MKQSTILAFLAGAAATGVAVTLTGLGPEHASHASAGHHQPEKDGQGHNGHGAGGDHHQTEMSPEEEMAAWMASSTPGEHHAMLARAVGSWSAKTSFNMEPGAPPMEGEGTMTCEWVLGGRFVKSEMHMDDMMGMPFDGLGYSGYDNLKKEFVGTWMDTFGTGIMMMTGTHTGEQATMVGTVMTPAGEATMKIVSDWQDDDHFTDTFYDLMPDGSWQKSGHVAYTRK